jgi:hypothetical protein
VAERLRVREIDGDEVRRLVRIVADGFDSLYPKYGPSQRRLRDS